MSLDVQAALIAADLPNRVWERFWKMGWRANFERGGPDGEAQVRGPLGRNL
jgi:hypothetical protein